MIRRESFGSRSEQKVVIDIIFVPFNLNILVHLLVVVHHGVHIEVIYLVVESAALQINSRAEVLRDLLRIYDVSRIRKIRLRLIFENTCLLPIRARRMNVLLSFCTLVYKCSKLNILVQKIYLSGIRTNPLPVDERFVEKGFGIIVDLVCEEVCAIDGRHVRLIAAFVVELENDAHIFIGCSLVVLLALKQNGERRVVCRHVVSFSVFKNGVVKRFWVFLKVGVVDQIVECHY